jgi:hypothetical protein
MRESRTHFEQIPVEVVKKIAEGSVSKDVKTSTDDVILDRTSGKRKPQTVSARALVRKGR